MKKQIMLGGLLLLLGSCTPQNKANDPNAIDIAVSLEHLTELKTSQLGKQIRYIPLETTDSSLIATPIPSSYLKTISLSLPTDDACHSTNKPENILAASGTKEKIHKATAMPTALFTPIPTISTFIANPTSW